MAGRRPNHLVNEKSPYLLQHAYNPVNWYPWGEEAFNRARAEDRPVFLSIGYSTCHWCHVMARESFENPRVAALMNAGFVNVKVDREERPEIDQVYMAAALQLMGTGGWPLTIVMTPEGKPFFTATYVPRESGHGLVGMIDLVPMIVTAWRERREELLTAADKATLLLVGAPPGDSAETAAQVVERVLGELASSFDPKYGGFGGAPKFPSPATLIFLIRSHRVTGDRGPLSMAEKTLRAMHAGGMYDHAGFGFHRYSMDASWLVPHYEKMLYDQALLAIAYTEAFRATGNEFYRRIAREILAYLERDLRADEGAFFSAEDAESGGREGAFYLWTRDEIGKILSGVELAAFVEFYGVCRDGNIPRRAGVPETRENILHEAKSPEEVAAGLGVLPGDLGPIIDSAMAKVRAARDGRVRPARDEKILADWNGLAIAAFAIAGRVLGNPEYTRTAEKAAGFILSCLLSPGGTLLHRYRSGDAAVGGNADDYAYLTWGLLEIYRSTHDTRLLDRAVTLTDRLIERFWDRDHGGFFFIPDDGETLIARLKPVHDGATPSSNSVAFRNLLLVSHLTGRTKYLDLARELEAWYLRNHAGSAAASCWMVAALQEAIHPPIDVVIVGDPKDERTRALLDVLDAPGSPDCAVLLKALSGDPLLESLAPFTKAFIAKPGEAAAYVCRNHACELPVTDPESLMAILAAAAKGQAGEGWEKG